MGHHPRDELLLLVLEPVEILLGPEEPGDGDDHVLIVEHWRVVEADPTQGAHVTRQNHLNKDIIGSPYFLHSNKYLIDDV